MHKWESIMPSPIHDLQCYRGESHLPAMQLINKPIKEFKNNVKV